jgi:hypothetical protein
MAFLLVVASAAGCSSPAGDDTRAIEGVVVDIRSGAGFGEVQSFTVKDGTEDLEVFVDPDASYDFPLAHLNAHRAGAEPVRIEAELRDGRLVATEIGDA